MKTALTAFAFFAIQLLLVEGAYSVGMHVIQLHKSWDNCVKSGEFEDWKKAFQLTDTDQDGFLSVESIAQLFTHHFNILHSRMNHEHQRIPKADLDHFDEEQALFVKHITDAHPTISTFDFSFDSFLSMMSTFNEHHYDQRSDLLDIAGHLFEH